MFEGDKHCEICKKEIPDKHGKFGVSLTGYTHTFCKGCFENKKDLVSRMLTGGK